VVSTFALVIGLFVANLMRRAPALTLIRLRSTPSRSPSSRKAKQQSTIDFVMNIIPNTIVDAFAKGDILQVLLIAILFGFSLSLLGERGKPVAKLIDELASAIFGMVGMVMKAAPIGAFGAMAFTIGKYGIASLKPLAALMGCFYLTCGLFVFVVLGAIARFTGFSIFKFMRYIREELLIVLGTSSSEARCLR
jgi:aerobic C4-dicarboxylate transport protein